MRDLISRSVLMKALSESVKEYQSRGDEDTQGYCDGWNDVVDIIKKQPTVSNDGWIPVSERLPETNESVLCWAESTAMGGDVCFVGSCHNGFWFLQSSADTHSFPGQYVIVAWQPLPPVYTVSSSEISNE